MGQIARKPSSARVHLSFQDAVFQKYGLNKAIFVEWLIQDFNQDKKSNLGEDNFYTQKDLSSMLGCSRTTLNLWLKELREDGIIIVEKSCDHHCRHNLYSAGPKYFELIKDNNKTKQGF